jgi:hypothetical protein
MTKRGVLRASWKWGHPLKGPLSRENNTPLQEKIVFLAEVHGDLAPTWIISALTFAAVSLGYCVSDIFTAPVTHQDYGYNISGKTISNP